MLSFPVSSRIRILDEDQEQRRCHVTHKRSKTHKKSKTARKLSILLGSCPRDSGARLRKFLLAKEGDIFNLAKDNKIAKD